MVEAMLLDVERPDVRLLNHPSRDRTDRVRLPSHRLTLPSPTVAVSAAGLILSNTCLGGPLYRRGIARRAGTPGPAPRPRNRRCGLGQRRRGGPRDGSTGALTTACGVRAG